MSQGDNPANAHAPNFTYKFLTQRQQRVLKTPRLPRELRKSEKQKTTKFAYATHDKRAHKSCFELHKAVSRASKQAEATLPNKGQHFQTQREQTIQRVYE